MCNKRTGIWPVLAFCLAISGPWGPFRALNASCQGVIGPDYIINQTITNNPQFKVYYQNLEYARGSFRVARSNFNTDLILNGQNSRNISQVSLDGPKQEIVSDYWSYSIAASRKLAFGTVLTPSLGVFNTGRDNLYRLLGDSLANQGSLFLNLEQPLLRGLGNKYNTAELKTATLGISSSEHRYLFEASNLLLQSLSAYIEYIAASRNLLIQEETEASMTETTRQLARLVELDALPGSELVVSEANLANQQTNTALARNRLALSRNILATTMGLKAEELGTIGNAPELFPFTSSVVNVDDGYSDSWIEESLKLRHDYLAAVNDRDASLIGLEFSRKGMLPGLNLKVGAGYNGLYEAQRLDQYYKPLTSNIPGMSYSIGITFDIAPRYDLQKGRKLQAMALNESAIANLQYLQLQLTREVRRDCNQLRYFLGATGTTREAVEFSSKALENEKKKLDLGVSTAFNVALMQNSYLNTLERENELLAQLNLAILQFKHHTGTLVTATGSNTFTVSIPALFILPPSP